MVPALNSLLRRVAEAPRLAVLGGAALLVASGSLIVRAADDPRVREVMLEFNRPIRQAVEAVLPVERLRVPRQNLAPHQSDRGAPPPARPTALNAPLPLQITSNRGFEPAARLPALPPAALPAPAMPRVVPVVEPAPRPAAPIRSTARRALGLGQGASVATNYCVRLCDGYAFPLGETGNGDRAQEVACRSACPGAPTALYSLPPGAQDLDQLRQGAARYSALPAAFRYRDGLDPACTCKPVGATLSSAALLADLTLRKGDVVMTRIGARHFDGSKTFPHRANAFSDALAGKLPAREVAIVRAMEVASVRGNLSSQAGPVLRARIIEGVRIEEARAARNVVVAAYRGAPSGFQELQAREQRGKTVLPVVKRPAGLVALN